MGKDLTTADLMRRLVDDIINDDRRLDVIYNKSKSAESLKLLGDKVIRDIGKYMMGFDTLLENLEEEERRNAEQGFVMLLKDITENENIIKKPSNDFFYFWMRWASEYEPIKVVK